MPTVHPRGTGLASSGDGRRIVWAEPGKLAVLDVEKRVRIAEAEVELDRPLELAISAANPERVLALQAKGGGTLLRVFSIPDLNPVVNARLKGEARVVAICASVAVLLSGTETVTIVDLGELKTASLPVRGPVQFVAQFSPDQILVASRGKLETWTLDERRPTHRLNLSAPTDAAFGGVASNGRICWFASTAGVISAFRLSDGKQIAELDVACTIKAIVADPASMTTVAAVVLRGSKSVQLVALDLASESHRMLSFDGEISAFCLAGAPSDSVAVIADTGEPVLLSLTGTAQTTVSAAVPEAAHTAPTKPVASAPQKITGNELSDKLSQWRAQLQSAMHAAPPRPLQSDERGRFSNEPRSRSRAELFAWGLSARARTTTTPPPPPQGWRLNDVVSRFQLDTRSRTVLALVYSSWLEGDGKTGLPVGVIARALGNDEEAWIDALAQGRLGALGFLKSDFGRTRLRPLIGRFLDEAPPRIKLVSPGEETVLTVAPPGCASVFSLSDDVGVDEQMRELASWLGAPVSPIEVASLPPAKLERILSERILEARLHGALPTIVGAQPTQIDVKRIDFPLLVTVRGASPAPWAELPAWPPALPTVDDDARNEELP